MMIGAIVTQNAVHFRWEFAEASASVAQSENDKCSGMWHSPNTPVPGALSMAPHSILVVSPCLPRTNTENLKPDVSRLTQFEGSYNSQAIQFDHVTRLSAN